MNHPDCCADRSGSFRRASWIRVNTNGKVYGMVNEKLIYALAKVIIAAAWVDGTISIEEQNSLKDLLFQVEGMTANDWAQLEIYMDSPVADDERERLVDDLRAQIHSQEDKDLVLSTLDKMVRADGVVSIEEETALAEVSESLGSPTSGVLKPLSALLKKPIDRRSKSVDESPNREKYLNDFVENKVYYEVRRRLDLGDAELSLPDDEVRKLSLAGGLLARIADVDDSISNEEYSWMVDTLGGQWDLSPEAATFVAEVAITEIGKGMDFFRMTRELVSMTTVAERELFVTALFRIAAADGNASFDETQEIRTVAYGLKLSHKQFIDAKLAGSSGP